MLRRQVNKTLLYSDIFDYPLTFEQIHKYLLTNKKISKEKVYSLIEKENLDKKNGFYYLNGRSKIVNLRRVREKESLKKIRLAFKISKVLKPIPTIKYLGISGSVSMKNADKNDDIDLFIISVSGTVWLTRLITVCFLKLLGVYRERNEINVSNKFCLNMIIDEKNLVFERNRQDVYSAHEILQTQPLFVKGDTYRKFISANPWTKRYLANFEPLNFKNENIGYMSKFFIQIFKILNFERVARWIQLTHMGKVKGKEIIGDGFLAFHPEDPRKRILYSYRMRLKEHNFITLGH